MSQKVILNARGLLPVLEALEAAGHQAHLVGGAVRNALMGLPIKDYDVATSAHPETVQALFEARGMTVHPTGIEHGTLTVVCEDEPFEITTWRQDVATDGRRATIRYAERLEDDAARRDFTFNALYMDLRGEILDPTGQGIDDANVRRVRFIGSAVERIQEDALRILRYFRFAAALGATLDIDSPDFDACAKQKDLLNDLSRERVGMEMRKILAAGNGIEVTKAMERTGILARVLPDRDLTMSGRTLLERLSDLNGQEAALGLVPCFSRRLALLQSDPPKEALCLSRAEVKLHERLVRAALSDMQSAELGYRMGISEGEDALCLAATLGRLSSDAASLEAMRAAHSRICPVSASDIMDRFQGSALGDALRRAEAIWIKGDFQTSKTTLMAAI